MALSGLESIRTFVVPDAPKPQVDVSREVEETTALLTYLGVVRDEDETREGLTEGYAALKSTQDASGDAVEGRLHVAPSIDVIPRPELLKAVSHLFGANNFYVDPEIWVPSRGDKAGYTATQLKKSAPKTEPAMALHSDNQDNPLLHFTGQPFDDMYKNAGEKTQLESLAELKNNFETEHLDRIINPLSYVAILGMAMEDKLAGRETLPIDWGFMRDGTLPRVGVGGDSFVGLVSSDRALVDLDRSFGYADSSGGVGASMGLKKS